MKIKFIIYSIYTIALLSIIQQTQAQPFIDEENILISSRSIVYYTVPLFNNTEINYYWFTNDSNKQLKPLNNLINNGLIDSLIDKGQNLGILYNAIFTEQRIFNGDYFNYDGTDSSVNNALKATENSYWNKLPTSIDSAALFYIYFPYFVDYLKKAPANKFPNLKQTIAKYIKNKKLGTIAFIEDWQFNAKKTCFNKNVIAYAFTTNNRYKDIPVLIKPNATLNKYEAKEKKELIKKIQYEYFFDASKSAHFINEYMRTSLVMYFYNLARANKIITYDYFTREKLNIENLSKRLGFIPIYSPSDYLSYSPMFVSVVEPAYFSEEFKSVIFEENWYLNKENLQFTKEVTGLAFVRYFYDDNDIENKNLRKEICFYVQLNSGN